MLEYYLNTFKTKGVVVDTNLLLLLFVGGFDPNLVPEFKRTKDYTEIDYYTLVNFLSHFDKIYYTPNIITEITNLSDSINSDGIFFHFIEQALSSPVFFEEFRATREVTKIKHFVKFGLTDIVNYDLAKEYLILTNDLKLYSFISSQGLPAINFNHIRDFYLR